MQAAVLKLLEEMNPSKSAEIDSLAGMFLNNGAPVLAAPISDLCNLSISLFLFPDECKIAKVKPLYKKEAKIKPKNYRPISLLPLISKVFEKIIHNQTQKFLDKNKILYSYKPGFRKYYSTDTCLCYFTHQCSHLCLHKTDQKATIFSTKHSFLLQKSSLCICC